MSADRSAPASQLTRHDNIVVIPGATAGIGRSAALAGLDADLLLQQAREMHGRS